MATELNYEDTINFSFLINVYYLVSQKLPFASNYVANFLTPVDVCQSVKESWESIMATTEINTYKETKKNCSFIIMCDCHFSMQFSCSHNTQE